MTLRRLIPFVFAFLLILGGCATHTDGQSTLTKVRLEVPGCEWTNTAARVSSILEGIDGVFKAQADFNDREVTVYYNEKRVSIEEIQRVLAENHFPVRGDPVFLD